MIIAVQTLLYFRESLVTVLERLIGPYYKRFSFSLKNKDDNLDDDDSEEQVFAEFDDEKGVVFFPPMYAQRYAAVNDCLLDERWCGKLEKIVDLGYHDMSFIKYLKEVPGVKYILGVDIETVPLRCSSDLIVHGEYAPKRENPLQITLFQGNAADPDYRLVGCDAVVAIEMIEHMLPHDLDRLVHNIFGFIQPHIAVITTPNADFNILFKAMEKNGLRRWDHLFEWTREQFNDWCSNIVIRYPNYTVTCKGIGPGPPGTLHHGCCSQLALFVSRDYHKQQDLTIDSLALVKNCPNVSNLSDMEESWECAEAISESNMICGPANTNSFSELLYTEKQSCMTIVVTTSSSLESLEYRDNTIQCNLDKEIGRSYLMFDEDISANLLAPRRQTLNRVYDMEDVTNRLNCSTLQVKKFSKATQNLMAKNKPDSIIHTREVVDEIQQLTKMLNFDKSTVDRKENTCIWSNINWGDNAPYWNQYYKIVRDYNYPFETKSDETRIIDLISDEINRLIDSQCTDEGVFCTDKLEIPLDYLMGVVEHITSDQNKVKDLLEWNGYKVVDNIVIHSRLVIENVSMATPEIEWQDNDTISDWDVTEIHSTCYSNGSAVSSQFYGKGLQHALDCKLRKLRALLTADEDITTELDRVVCRLMKLALKTSGGRDTPPPASWLQFKLLDLLTLTERAIERRKRHYFDRNPLTVQSKDLQGQTIDKIQLPKAEDSKKVKEIVDKYCHLIQPTEGMDHFDDLIEESYGYVHSNVEVHDDSSVTSNELVRIFDYNDDTSSSSTRIDRKKILNIKTRERKSATKEHCKLGNYFSVSSSGDTDVSIKMNLRNVSKKANRTSKEVNNHCHSVNVLRARSKRLNNRDSKINEKYICRNDKKKFLRGIIEKKNLLCYLLKNNISSVDYELFKIGIKKRIRQHRLTRSFTKPIPNNLINFCPQEANTRDHFDSLRLDLSKNNNNMLSFKPCQESIAVTENSCLLEIVTDGKSETIALRRTVATDSFDCSYTISEQLLPSLNEEESDKNLLITGSAESRPMFLFDINEPSTSKGIRHVNMDVQCGSDAVLSPVLSPTTSQHNITSAIKNGDKEDFPSNLKRREECYEFNVPGRNDRLLDDDILNYRVKSNGIQIRDSDAALILNEDRSTGTYYNNDFKEIVESTPKNDFKNVVQSVTNIKEVTVSCAEFDNNPSYDNYNVKSRISNTVDSEKSTTNIDPDNIIHVVNKEGNMDSKISVSNEDVKRKLTCGGIIIHSYKNRIICEDILYQGKWQHSALKIIKKNPCHTITIRKNPEQNVTKAINYNKEILMQKSLEKTRIKNINYRKCRRKLETEKLKGLTSQSIEKPILSSTPIKCPEKKIIKAMSKISLSPVLSKYTRSRQMAMKKVDKPFTPQNSDKEKKKVVNTRKKNYIPQYLQSRKCMSKSKNFEKIVDPIIEGNKIGVINDDFLINPGTKDIKKELLKYICDPCHKITYSVFRNKVEKGKNNESRGLIVEELNNNEDKSNLQSGNSSCSSNNSIATIKQLSPQNKDSKRKFISSKSNLRLNNATKSSSIRKNKDYHNKSTVVFDNKENNPEPSKVNKERKQEPAKSTLMPRNTYSDNKKQSKQGEDNVNVCLSSVSLCKTVLLADPMHNVITDTQSYVDSYPQNQVFILETYKTHPLIENIPFPQSSQAENQEIVLRNEKLSIEDIETKKVNNNSVNLYHEMLSMIEEKLDFIDSNGDREITEEDCIIREKVPSNQPLASFSAASSCDSGPKPVQVDMISFKSFASISGYSEYFLADNDQNSTLDSHKNFTPPERSVQDLFERNDQSRFPNSGGLMDVQGFSGFSINEQMIGDQPDYVNLIDSETGSLAHCVEVRRATSEEVFTSGRSSDTYVSCQVDDDTVVPHWLFRATNQQQQSDEEPMPPALASIPLPTVAPQLDVNGNISEPGIGSGAGAGDGRGMHSDRDSSGRDTSMSSTETSSGQQSEALLVEPSTFNGNLEFLREPSSRPFLQIPSTGLPNISYRTGPENDNVYNMTEISNSNAMNHETIPSDRDADVSSLDTDIADFSDN